MDVDLGSKVCLQQTKTYGYFGCPTVVQIIGLQNLQLEL
jgi:hypothetical protein